jgi:hypothetical protein
MKLLTEKAVRKSLAETFVCAKCGSVEVVVPKTFSVDFDNETGEMFTWGIFGSDADFCGACDSSRVS